MIKGHVLIKLVPGLETEALNQIRSIPGVNEVSLVFGQWDAIVIVEAKTIFELTRVVVSQIRGVQGIQDTTTLVGAD